MWGMAIISAMRAGSAKRARTSRLFWDIKLRRFGLDWMMGES